MTPTTTTVGVLTPPGAAAVATLALAGPRAWAVAREQFRPAGAPLPDRPPLDRFWYGHFGDPPGDAVVLAVKCLSPVPRVEVHCHGGPEVVRWLIERLRDSGVRSVGWDEAVSCTGESPFRTAAAAELARAATQRTAGILLDQWHGAFDLALDAIDRALVEDDRHRARALVSDILGRAPLGRHLTRPWRVAVAGAPNVGKSSLVNALAGYQRSVVTPIPGTTRDVVMTVLAVDGWPVELLDTAGQHLTADRLEGQGIARARSAAATADLCLWVVDVTAAPVWPDTGSPNLLRVLNKTDRPAAWDTAAVAEAVSISALAGVGLDHLCERISRRLVPDPPSPGAAVPFTDDLIVRLEEYLQALGTISAAEGRGRLAAFRGRPTAPLPPA